MGPERPDLVEIVQIECKIVLVAARLVHRYPGMTHVDCALLYFCLRLHLEKLDTLSAALQKKLLAIIGILELVVEAKNHGNPSRFPVIPTTRWRKQRGSRALPRLYRFIYHFY